MIIQALIIYGAVKYCKKNKIFISPRETEKIKERYYRTKYNKKEFNDIKDPVRWFK